MSVLERIFGGAVDARNALYDRGTFRARRLQCPVISVGNISVGGSGKTPFVMMLGEWLRSRGIPFDILTRGYRRKSSAITVVDPNGPVREFGDEPMLLATRLAVDVIVGPDRYRSGMFSEEKFGPRLHLLDDGFQHRQLARDFDIVLLTPEDEDDHLLPGGRLREPRTAVQRADAVALMRGARCETFPLRDQLVWQVHRGIEIPDPPSRPLAFCGIAKPEVFFGQLRANGTCPGAQISFRDHHAYSERDVQRLLDVARQRSTNGFVTTEKDAVNLGCFADRFQPLLIAKVKMTLDNLNACFEAMLGIVAERRPDFRL